MHILNLVQLIQNSFIKYSKDEIKQIIKNIENLEHLTANHKQNIIQRLKRKINVEKIFSGGRR